MTQAFISIIVIPPMQNIGHKLCHRWSCHVIECHVFFSFITTLLLLLSALRSSPSKRGRGSLAMPKYSGPGAAWSISQLPSERDDNIYDLRGARSFPTLEDEGIWPHFQPGREMLALSGWHVLYIYSMAACVNLSEWGLCFLKGAVRNDASFELTLFCLNTEPKCGTIFP